jgi:hypothetical protein
MGPPRFWIPESLVMMSRRSIASRGCWSTILASVTRRRRGSRPVPSLSSWSGDERSRMVSTRAPGRRQLTGIAAQPTA